MTKKQLRAMYRAIDPNWSENATLYARYKQGLPPAGKTAKPKKQKKTKPPKAPRPARPVRPERTVRRAPEPEWEEPAPTPRRSSRKSPPPSGVMLAKKWKGSDPRGWWMSEKLDGMRAYWTGDALYTRNGNPIAAPTWFTDVLPAGIALDGEIYMGRGRFQETVSVTRKATARDPRWKEVCYMAFDAPEVSGGCEKRFSTLKKIVKDACRNWRRGGRCPLVFVEQTSCTSRAGLDDFHKRIEKMRGEGVMLRAPGSRYSRSRTSDLLKVKSFVDAEAKIIGYTEGTGRHAGRLGAYQAQLLGSGVRFKIGTGISDRERDRPLRKGTIVTVSFQGLTDAGLPRFPSLVGARDYE